MLEKSDTSIAEALKEFNAFDIEVGLLVPTKTGMEKSIMDATASLREFLRDVGVHNYETQEKGPDAKVIKRAFYIRQDGIEEIAASLYRPQTKDGDPRIWFSSLRRYAQPFNLLAVIVDHGDIYIVNCSTPGLLQTLHDRSTPLGELAERRKSAMGPAASELLELLREISRRGYVGTKRPGDTGIGMTLESLLGIAANTKRTPDYKGIEIKAKRLGSRSGSRATLFSQVPNWSLSPIGSAWNLLSEYGYERDGKLRLNHEIDAKGPNSIGFLLQVDASLDWLKQCHFNPVLGATRHLVTWELETLRSRLAEKHPQTFWVSARCRGRLAEEEFHYVQVQHTGAPRVRNFDALLEAGLVSVDYLMSQKTSGRQSVRDHGYLFKMRQRDFDALFPTTGIHVLAE